MRFSRFGFCFVVLFSACACFAQMYTVTDLGTLHIGDNAWSSATGINDAGQVIGQSNTPIPGHYSSNGFRTAPNSAINPATDDLGEHASPAGINASGQMVGYFYNGLVIHAFRTAPNSPVNPETDDLGTLRLGIERYEESMATAINARGQVVGTSFGISSDIGDVQHAFRTAPNKAINAETDDLGRFPGSVAYSEAHGINFSGQVVGFFATDAVNGHAFRTAPNRAINPETDDLGTLNLAIGDFSTAYAINDFGQAVGVSWCCSEFYFGHAFRTAPNHAINPATDDLGTLPGGTYSFAMAIDNFGQVVGFSDGTGYDFYHAFLYSGDAMHDLNDLIPVGSGWELSSAVGINSKGQIAANGERNGSGRALLLTPIYTADVQQPINADGSSTFSVDRAVIPVKFAVTKYGSEPSCTLPATISVTRATRQTLTFINESTYSTAEDNSSSFRITGCQYHYNLPTRSFGLGTYRVEISINGIMVGHAVFALK